MKSLLLTLGLSLAFASVGCQSTAPQNPIEQDKLISDAQYKLKLLRSKHPGVYETYQDTSVAVAVFPTIGEGGLLLGYGYGKGVLFENGKATGYCDVNEGIAGAVVGAKVKTQYVFIRNKSALNRFKAGNVEMTAQVAAVAAAANASNEANYNGGFALIVTNEKGLMAQASVSGQKFRYLPKDAVD